MKSVVTMHFLVDFWSDYFHMRFLLYATLHKSMNDWLNVRLQETDPAATQL